MFDNFADAIYSIRTFALYSQCPSSSILYPQQSKLEKKPSIDWDKGSVSNRLWAIIRTNNDSVYWYMVIRLFQFIDLYERITNNDLVQTIVYIMNFSILAFKFTQDTYLEICVSFLGQRLGIYMCRDHSLFFLYQISCRPGSSYI